MAERGITSLTPISPGTNISFAKCGYQLGGTLINNTRISGSIESMNRWHKAS